MRSKIHGRVIIEVWEGYTGIWAWSCPNRDGRYNRFRCDGSGFQSKEAALEDARKAFASLLPDTRGPPELRAHLRGL